MSTPPRLRYRERAAKGCGYKHATFRECSKQQTCRHCNFYESFCGRKECNNPDAMEGFAVSGKKVCLWFEKREEEGHKGYIKCGSACDSSDDAKYRVSFLLNAEKKILESHKNSVKQEALASIDVQIGEVEKVINAIEEG